MSNTPPTVRTHALRFAQVTAYVAVAFSLWPSVRLPPIQLDDRAALQELSQAAFWQVFEVDRFGHLRPLKSALFWLLSRHLEWLTLWRAVALIFVLATARLWQQLCTPLLQRDKVWALAAALCWAVNPITASSLCWLSTANLVVAGLASLAFVWLSDRSLDTTSATLTVKLSACASLVIAVASHELALLAPLLFLAYRYLRLGRTWSPSERRRSIALALACLAGCALLWLGLHALSTTRAIDYRFASHPRALLMGSAPRYIGENLRLWLWLPGRFGVLIPAEPTQQLWLMVLAWVAFALVCLLLWRVCARDAALAFGVLTCASTLLPVTNLIPIGNTPVALHYLYLPGLGLSLVLVRVAQRLGAVLRDRLVWLPAALLLLLTAAWLPEQRRVLAAWTDAASLYSATIHNDPDNIEARVNLAALYLDQQKYVEADTLLSDSLKRAPSELGLLLNRFKLLAETGKVDEALAFFAAHPELDLPRVQIVRGALLMRVQRFAQARDAFRRAYERSAQPDERLTAGKGLVLSFKRLHDDAQARRVVDALLAEFPQYPELRFLMLQ